MLCEMTIRPCSAACLICHITDSIQRVFFQVAKSDTLAHEVVDKYTGTLSWTEGVAKSLSCVSVGGYPPPSVAVLVDSVDITDQFSLSHSATLHGTRGLRVITYTTERYWTLPFLYGGQRRIQGGGPSIFGKVNFIFYIVYNV